MLIINLVQLCYNNELVSCATGATAAHGSCGDKVLSVVHCNVQANHSYGCRPSSQKLRIILIMLNSNIFKRLKIMLELSSTP